MSPSFCNQGLKPNDLLRFSIFYVPYQNVPFPSQLRAWNEMTFFGHSILDGPYQNVPYQNVPCAKQCILFKSEIPSSVIRHLSFIFTRKEKKS